MRDERGHEKKGLVFRLLAVVATELVRAEDVPSLFTVAGSKGSPVADKSFEVSACAGLTCVRSQIHPKGLAHAIASRFVCTTHFMAASAIRHG